MVVIDNLSCLFPTLREDKRDDWASKAQPFILWFRRHGIAVIIVHHTNKQGDQSGSVAKINILNLAIALSPLPESESKGEAEFSITFPKHRSVWGDAIAPIEVRLIKNEHQRLEWKWRALEESNEDRLLKLVHEGITQVKDAAELLGLTDGAVSKLKKKLIDKGLLKDARQLLLAEKKQPTEVNNVVESGE